MQPASHFRKSVEAESKISAQVSFQWKNPDTPLKNPDFLLKSFTFII